ncbi:MAG TPA: hypothetical protein VN155_17075 [Devosia sp.]|nr:hypothetical protein [Devosia sp.]
MSDYLKWLVERQRIAEARIAAMTTEDYEAIVAGNAVFQHLLRKQRVDKPKGTNGHRQTKPKGNFPGGT